MMQHDRFQHLQHMGRQSNTASDRHPPTLRHGISMGHKKWMPAGVPAVGPIHVELFIGQTESTVEVLAGQRTRAGCKCVLSLSCRYLTSNTHMVIVESRQ